MNDTIQVLKQRRSVRSYRPEPIRQEELDAVLEAGSWAPSAMGRQSVTMVVLREKDQIQRLSRYNAAVMGTDSDPFYGAPVVVVVLADPEATNNVNAICDGALVMGNLMNAAWSLGIGSCWINRAREVFEKPEGKALLREWGLPERYIGVGNCVLGYPAAVVEPGYPRKENGIIYPSGK